MDSEFSAEAQAVNRAATAALAWIVYDTALSLGDEITFIWRSPHSLPKTMYLWSRYQGLILSTLFAGLSVSTLTDEGCRVYTPIATVGTVLVTIPADALLLMRIMALFAERRRLCRWLLIYFYAEKLVEFAIVCVAAHIEVDHPAPSYSGTTGCFHITEGENPLDSLPALVIALLYNAVLFSLTLVKLYPYWKMGGYGLTPLLTIFVRDGAMYFAMICCLLILEMIVPPLAGNQPALATILVPWLIAGYPVASCRLLLHLRGSIKQPTVDPTLNTADIEMPTFRVQEFETVDLEVARTSTLEDVGDTTTTLTQADAVLQLPTLSLHQLSDKHVPLVSS